jgi:PAS domain S-box-containing protein
VTKQVLAERRLRLTQEAVDSSITAVALLDGDNRISYANRALLRLWGAGEDEEVLGLPATHLWCEPAWFRAGLSQLGEAGRWIGESVACRLDGSTFCGRVAATVVNDQEGALLARVLFIQDVSEERRVVEELRVSEARLTRAQEIAHIASWDRDLKDGTYTWSKGIYRIFGLPEGDPDRFLADLRHVHPDDRKRLAAAMTESIENPSSPYSVEYRIILPDGTVRTVYSRGELVTDPDGKPLRFSGFIQDITDRARVQAAFADSEARVRQILQSAAVGLVTTDAAGLIQSFNPAAERIFGYTADEVRGTSIALLAEDPDGHHDLITAPPLGEDGTTGTPPHRELVGHRKNGDAVPIEMAVSRMEIRGETTLIATILDVSERRAAEDRLRQAQKMETVGQLTGGVAHDFNNVLMALQLNLEAVQEEVSADPEAAECIRAGLHAVQRGSELTSRLLAFSRQQPLQPIVTDVNALILQTMRLLDRTLEESVRVETSLVGGLWPIEVDQGQFANAIINLALNARDAMPQGGTLFLDTRNLTLDADNPALAEGGKAGDYVRIAVGDTGTGIPPEVLQRVFEPFFTTKEVGKGSGLGLSMVYGFVKQSGGHIHIDTADGRGTTISLYFPRVAAVPKALQPDARAGAATGRGEVILLVEDDTIVRAALVRQLGRLGYAVQGVRNGIEALRLLDRGAVPDLLITDVVLPEGMSGVEVSRAVRSRHPDCRTLYVSGYSDREITHEGRLDAGVVLLSKPFPRELLAAKVRELLDDVRAA